jgi:hypothetical protein
MRVCPACGKSGCFDHEIRTRFDAAFDKKAEHQQLKDAVVETAKAARILRRSEAVHASEYLRALSDTMHAERDAVDALIEFEKQEVRNAE